MAENKTSHMKSFQNVPEISIIIPVYNEAEGVEAVLRKLNDYLEQSHISAEILAVDDGSSDATAEILASLPLPFVRVITHPINRGYGAALKTGVHHAQGSYIAFYDGDGQHVPEELQMVLDKKDKFDMVVGARTGYKGPLWRQPGKRFISALANYLVSFNIPDLNSGLRVVRKDVFQQFAHLYPNGFSLSTTITLALIKEGFSVGYVPITIKQRIGKSTLKIRDGFATISLVLRIIMLFAPFRIFTPVSLVLFIFAGISLIYDVLIAKNIGDNSLLFGISALLIFLFGLLADQVAAVRRELGAK